ncbi:hypothetical protein [Nocardioides sp. SR21]|uniref:hypothetical protein n=1 Tax=Nocardioides sp. SR21 TaxID=2919501 RepID=UPI001FA94C11|nr:hypothetical protein [Nocardioides sp. SR21]
MPDISRLAGGALATATHALATVRTAAKPLHPSGKVFHGSLRRLGSTASTGVAWLDEPGTDDVEVRLSRAVGLPDALPDIHGLAVRVHGPDGPGDLLFANTGTRRLTRYLLTATRDPGRPMTTLLPYRTPTGAVLLRADGAGDGSFELCWARPSGPWTAFATLQLGERQDDSARLSFDPLLHRVPGLEQYDAVVRLREPAYRRARRTR